MKLRCAGLASLWSSLLLSSLGTAQTPAAAIWRSPASHAELPGSGASKQTPPDRPREGPFVTSFELGPSELWVAGVRIPGPVVTCEYDGTVLRFSDLAEVQLQIPPYTPEVDDEAILAVYGAVPFFQAARAAGASLFGAARLYDYEKQKTVAPAIRRCKDNQPDGAVEGLLDSPLVEDASFSSETNALTVQFVGQRLPRHYSVDRLDSYLLIPAEPDTGDKQLPQSRLDHKARSLVEGIRSRVSESRRGTLVLVNSRGGTLMGGESALGSQLALILQGAPIDSIATYPFSIDTPPLSEIFAHHPPQGRIQGPDTLSQRERLLLVEVTPLGTDRATVLSRLPGLSSFDDGALHMSFTEGWTSIDVTLRFAGDRLSSIEYRGSGQQNACRSAKSFIYRAFGHPESAEVWEGKETVAWCRDTLSIKFSTARIGRGSVSEWTFSSDCGAGVGDDRK